MLRDRLGLSERRACRNVGQHRSTQRRDPQRAEDDRALRAELRKISAQRPRWGYRRAHHRLREDGWAVNRKRVARLWREEGCDCLRGGASAGGWESRRCQRSGCGPAAQPGVGA